MAMHQFPEGLLKLLGFSHVLEPDGEWVRMVFDGRDEHAHSNGTIIQGGILTAWMDHAMARAVIARDPTSSIASLEIKASFLARVPPGPSIVTARGVKWGRKIAFLEATVQDEKGQVLVTCSSTGMLVSAG